MKFLLLLVSLLVSQATVSLSTETNILKTLQSQKTATVIVSFKGSNVAALRNQVQLQTYSSRTHKLNSFYNLLKDHADTTQAKILNFLEEEQTAKSISVEQLWISNQIIVRDADYSVVQKLLAMDEVAEVREEQVFPLERSIDTTVHPNPQVPYAGEPWGIAAIRAPEVWATGNRGKGVVVGGIDTGVLFTHEALRDGFREDYGWYDPFENHTNPVDEEGHGTHTMATIVGRKYGIGVAPEAEWIACRGCVFGACFETLLLRCGQWMSCPTYPEGNNADCSKAPHVVSNSWGGSPGNSFYDDVISAWKVANIAPIFAIGNNGSYGCGTAKSPGDSVDAIGVGATTVSNELAYFSGLGPTKLGQRIKPEIAAPGYDILSAGIESDYTYAFMSGTSMACPHAAGVAALLYGENPRLTYTQVRSALLAGAQPITTFGNTCGGISDSEYPNHQVGHGRIDAVASLEAVKGL